MSENLRANHDRRAFRMGRMAITSRVQHYLDNPQDYFVDRQFRFGSAGTRYAVMLNRALDAAVDPQCLTGFDRAMAVHFSVAASRLDDLALDTAANIAAIAKGCGA